MHDKQNTLSMSFDMKFIRLDKKTRSLAILTCFLKRLINFISKDLNMVFSIYQDVQGLCSLSGPEVIKLFSCSTQLSMKFILIINVEMPTTVGILTFMGRINGLLFLSKPENFINSGSIEISMNFFYNLWAW